MENLERLDNQWVKTSRDVYLKIYTEHKKDLVVFSQLTAVEGDPRLGLSKPYLMTEWGFSWSKIPLIKSEGTKESVEQKEWDMTYGLIIQTEPLTCKVG